jgi:hypothetical protein
MLTNAPYTQRIANLVGGSHIPHAEAFADMPLAGVDLTPLMQVLHQFNPLVVVIYLCF